MSWIVLHEDEKGRIEVLREDLTKKMSEIWSDEDLAPLAEKAGVALTALKEMTWIAFIKSDIAGKDIQGYKRYTDVLKKEGFDV